MNGLVIPCQICGQQHALNEMELSFGLPDDVFTIAENERDTRVKASEDICIIDDARFFIRSTLGLPLIDHQPDYYHFGVWAEVGANDFRTIFDLWDDPEQINYPAFQATLTNNIPFCGQSNGTAVALRLTGATSRPSLSVTAPGSIIGKLQGEGIYMNDTMRFLHFDQDLPDQLT